jgi:hypothetical protein
LEIFKREKGGIIMRKDFEGYIAKETARRIIDSPRSREQMLSVLKGIPPEDVERVRHGFWVVSKGGHDYIGSPSYTCSECHAVYDEAFNSCPNCRALMDEQVQK